MYQKKYKMVIYKQHKTLYKIDIKQMPRPIYMTKCDLQDSHLSVILKDKIITYQKKRFYFFLEGQLFNQ